MPNELYETLGVDVGATAAEIKAAGRKAQKATHPDHGGDAEKFREVTQALAVLLDPEKRGHYDKTGEADFRKGADTATNEALDLLAKMVAKAMSSADPRYLNLPKEVGALVESNIEAFNQKLGEAERDAAEKIATMDGFLKRMKRKKGQDMIRLLLEGQRADLQRALEKYRSATQHSLRINSMVLEMLSDYEYETERPPTGQTYMPGSLQEAIMRETARNLFRNGPPW